jgi:hypothetical protein
MRRRALVSPARFGEDVCGRKLGEVLPEAKSQGISRGVQRCHDFSACTFTPLTPYLRATRSFEVPPKGSKYSEMRTDLNPTDSNTNRSSASGRAPAIQPVHKSMSRLIDSESSLATMMSA